MKTQICKHIHIPEHDIISPVPKYHIMKTSQYLIKNITMKTYQGVKV